MICKPCRLAADIFDTGHLARMAKKEWHGKCKGSTWCDCQHRMPK